MKNIINTEKAPSAIGSYVQGVNLGNLIFLSGQLPVCPKEGKIIDECIEGQTKQSLENVKNILEAAGSSMSSIVKTTVFLSDIANFTKMNEVYTSFFEDGNFPARSAFQVAALPLGALVEIEAIALL